MDVLKQPVEYDKIKYSGCDTQEGFAYETAF